MTAYRVTIMHDACTTHDVTASSEDDAISAAMDEASPCLCHQCADQIELGDPIRAVAVENLETGETNDDPDPDFEVVQLRERVAELEAALAAAPVAPADQSHAASYMEGISDGRAEVKPALVPTDAQIVAAARAINKMSADACNVDESDSWKLYGNSCLIDAAVVLKAAYGIKP